MATKLEINEGAIVCRDIDAIPEAAELLLHDAMLDLLVVRGLIRSKAALADLLHTSDAPIERALYDQVPSLTELDTTVAAFWDRQGYTDYRLTSSHLIFSHIQKDGLGIHTDYPYGKVGVMPGPLSLSICTDGAGLYHAEKPHRSFQAPSGKFSRTQWVIWKKSPLPHDLRTTVEQGAGDGIFFMNHPRQTLHAVTQTSANRSATLFDYMITKR